MRSKAHCEKIIEDGARPTDCRDEPRSKVPFVRSPPMRSPGHIVHAKCDHYFSSFVSRKRMPRRDWMWSFWFVALPILIRFSPIKESTACPIVRSNGGLGHSHETQDSIASRLRNFALHFRWGS